jgi:hypothetical protein
MALAVAEANRILRPGGTLLDIHPEARPMRLELWTARAGVSLANPERPDPASYLQTILGDFEPDEHLVEFRASTETLAQAEAVGFTARRTIAFEYRYFFDTLDELHDYLEENNELDLAGDDLLERALLALQAATQPANLVLIQSVIATRLVKHAK